MRWLYGFAVVTAVFGVTLGGFFFGINTTDPAVGQAAQPVICVSGCSGSGGGGAVFGPTAAGSAAANPPVLLGGTADGTATGLVENLKVDSNHNAYVNVQASVLPTGAGTAANQATIISSLSSIETNTGTPLAGVSVAQTSAAASSLAAKTTPGSVVSISGSAVSGSYIMLFDATSAPADGAVTPKKCWGPMAAAGPFSLAWGVGPVLPMSTGITVVSSSTGCFSKTATNAAFLSVEYQ